MTSKDTQTAKPMTVLGKYDYGFEGYVVICPNCKFEMTAVDLPVYCNICYPYTLDKEKAGAKLEQRLPSASREQRDSS